MVFALMGSVGFTEDIGAQPEDLNTAVSLFFVTFVTFQPLSAAVGRWVGARNWIPILMVGRMWHTCAPKCLLS